MPPEQAAKRSPRSAVDRMWLAHVCRHLLLDDVIVERLHFFTITNKDIYYQMTSVDFNMKKEGRVRPLAIIRMRFKVSPVRRVMSPFCWCVGVNLVGLGVLFPLSGLVCLVVLLPLFVIG